MRRRRRCISGPSGPSEKEPTSSAGHRGGEAGQVAKHGGVSEIVDRPGHLQAELTGGSNVHELLPQYGSWP